MMAGHTLRLSQHESYPLASVLEKFTGKGNDRNSIGTSYKILLPFDSFAPVEILIEGEKPKIAQELLNERNMKMDLVMAKFQDLVISFSGGDYGAINYRGKASGVEFLNLTPAQTAKREG